MTNGKYNMENDMVITSISNDRLKHARRVRDGREPDLIFVEGERLIEECLQSGLKLTACFHEPDLTPRAQRIIAEMASRDCPLYPARRARDCQRHRQHPGADRARGKARIRFRLRIASARRRRAASRLSGFGARP